MTRHSRLSPASSAAMVEFDAAMLAPILADFRAHLAVARRLTPGGQLNDDDLRGVARTVARTHRVTPEDLARWHLAYPEIRT